MKMKKWFLFIFLFLLIVMIPQANIYATTKITSGSSIANVELSGLTTEEAKEKLQTELDAWLAGDPIIAKSDLEQISIPRSSFQFDLDATLTEMKQQTKRHWSRFFRRKQNILLPIHVSIKDKDALFEEWPDRIDKEKTIGYIKTVVENLGTQHVKIAYQSEPENDLQTVAEISIPIKKLSKTDMKYMADSVTGVSIPIEQTFSFLESVHLPEQFTTSEKEVDFFATAFYSLFLQTNVNVLEKHSQQTVPNYGKPGVEATVNPEKAQDLLIYNPNHFSYIIDAKVDGEKLILSLQSVTSEYTYKYKLKDTKKVNPKTIYRYSRDLMADEEIILEYGKPGEKVDVYRYTYSKNGGFIDEELMKHAYYPSSPKVILTSNKTLVDQSNENVEEQNNDIEKNEEQEEEQSEINQDNHNNTQKNIQADDYEKIIGETEKQLEKKLFESFKKEYCKKEKEKKKTDGPKKEKTELPWDICDEDNEELNQLLFTFMVLNFFADLSEVPEMDLEKNIPEIEQQTEEVKQ